MCFTDCLLFCKDIQPDDCQSNKIFCCIHLLHVLLYATDMQKVRLVSIIGQGSFGTVYKAVWRGSVVAAKVIQVGDKTSKIMGEVEKCK